ncbi:hypothetical protein MMC30_006952 [Trapelia coarctata]|nr:hypothetical protein [Trapelia coarctata]
MASKRALSSLHSIASQPSRVHPSFAALFSPRPCSQRTPPRLVPQRRWNSQPTHPSPSSTSATPSEPSDTPAQFKEPQPIKSWSYEDILALTTSPSPSPKTILIDVREPRETAAGHIPGAKFLPITSNPDALFLPPEEFEERFGWQKPGPEKGVVFYCKAGVRSRAAARMAREGGWGGEGGVGEFVGSWDEWIRMGGGVGR